MFADTPHVPTCSVFALVPFSVKLQFRFLQQPELGITLERSTFQKGKTLHQHQVSTLDHSRLLGWPVTTLEAFSGSWASLPATELQLPGDQDKALNAVKIV